MTAALWAGCTHLLPSVSNTVQAAVIDALGQQALQTIAYSTLGVTALGALLCAAAIATSCGKEKRVAPTRPTLRLITLALRLTARTHPKEFHGQMRMISKSVALQQGFGQSAGRWVGHFNHLMALCANHQLRGMGASRLNTEGIGIEACYFVHEVV